jgi:multisubunit Na+/H+ antiporter MnhB subunit
METPDITRAQVVAIAQAILAVVVAFGIDLSETQQTAILGLAGALAIVLPLADAIIRNGRSRVYAASVTAQHDED